LSGGIARSSLDPRLLTATPSGVGIFGLAHDQPSSTLSAMSDCGASQGTSALAEHPPMKTILALLFAVSSAAFAQEHIAVKVTDSAGNAVEKAQVVAILKSGAYQDTKLVDGTFICDPTERCVKVYVAAQGYEGAVKPYSGGAGSLSVALKPSDTKNSAIIRGSGSLPPIKGTVNPMIDSSKRMYMYANKIGLETNGQPAEQPLHFALNRPISAMTPTGQRFKIWVTDITQEVSLLEYSIPK
jgi:hypothetical protein